MNKLALLATLAITTCQDSCNSFSSKGAPADAGPIAEVPVARPPEPANSDPLATAGLERFSVTVQNRLEESIRGTNAADIAPSLAQVTARLLLWWVNIVRELRKGDRVEVIFQRIPNKEPLVHAIKFYSTKDQKEYSAYLYKPPKSRFSRYYDATGEEIEERLENSPIDDYEQVTSLLRDGRKHKGVDFKTPVNSPVKIPFDATLTRKNWSFRGNGNCLEFRDNTGRRIVFLHLSSIAKEMALGKQVKAGEVIAYSGNTGHSTAPHLHYQLENPSGRLLDPFNEHKTFHARLDQSDLAAFKQTREKYEKMLAFVASPAQAGAVPSPATATQAPTVNSGTPVRAPEQAVTSPNAPAPTTPSVQAPAAQGSVTPPPPNPAVATPSPANPPTAVEAKAQTKPIAIPAELAPAVQKSGN